MVASLWASVKLSSKPWRHVLSERVHGWIVDGDDTDIAVFGVGD